MYIMGTISSMLIKRNTNFYPLCLTVQKMGYRTVDLRSLSVSMVAPLLRGLPHLVGL